MCQKHLGSVASVIVCAADVLVIPEKNRAVKSDAGIAWAWLRSVGE
jgi:hypothetical protein